MVVSLGYCIADRSRNFHMQASTLGIKWQDHVTNPEVLDLAHSSSTESMLIRTQLRWVGYVICVEENCLPRCML